MRLERRGVCRCGVGEARAQCARMEEWKVGFSGWCRRIPWPAALVCGTVLVIAGGMVTTICGAPLHSQGALLLGDRMPSVAWMTLLWSVWYFLLGASFGCVIKLGGVGGVISLSMRTLYGYRGSLYFLPMILLGYLWYPLFFWAARFTLCVFLSALLVLLALAAGLNYWRVMRVAGAIVLLHAIFLLCCTLYLASLV